MSDRVRGESLARLLRLRDLLVSGSAIKPRAFAARHGYSVRTVYRDLHVLELAGVPVTQSKNGRWGLL